MLKAAREKWHIMYKETPVQWIPDFSTEAMVAREQWDNIFKMPKEKPPNYQTRISYTAETILQKWGRN